MRIVLVALLLAGALFWFLRGRAPAPLETSAGDPAGAVPVAGSVPPAEEFRLVAEQLYAGDSVPFGRAPRLAFEAELRDPSLSAKRRVDVEIDLAREYVEANQVARGIALLEEAVKREQSAGRERQVRRLHAPLGMAWLREAENQNCIVRHNADCCIFPPRAGAIHQVRQPAEEARRYYTQVLADDPDDLGARWLVNLTTLLLGEALDALPEEQRLPPRAFGESRGEPLFHDVAERAGVGTQSLAGGVAVEDFDGDGWLDLLTSNSDPRGALEYFHSNGDGTFENRSESSHVSEQLGGLNLISGDYDEDGDQDAFVLRGAWLLDHGRIRNSLLRNERGERFEDVTRAAGVAEPACPTQAATFGDFDGDGSPDLYIGNESRVEVESGQGDYPSQLFHNRGDGTFVDVAADSGVRNDRYAKGVAAGDYDDDGDLDLYVSNIGPNRLYRNDGRGRFVDMALAAGVTEPVGRSFACWFFDYDEDGRLDLWVDGYAATIADLAANALWQPDSGVRSCLYRNQGEGRFLDVAAHAGLDHPWVAMGANFGDVDGDGWQDVYLGTGDPKLESLMPNVLLHNLAGQSFRDDTASSGLGHLQKGHGVAFADFDHDGDQDLFHHLGGFVPVDTFQSALFENRTPAGHRWLVLSLVGTKTNRDAIGARVTLELATPAGPRALHRAAGSVSSFGGSPHELEIGLGDAERITRLEVRWPNGGATQVFEPVPLDAWLRVTEGSASFERLEWKSYHF